MGSWTSGTAQRGWPVARCCAGTWIAGSLLCAGCVLPHAAGKAGTGAQRGRPPTLPEAPPAAPRPQQVFIGVDTSGSMTPAERRAVFGMVYPLCDQVLRAGPHLAIFAYDERVHLLFDSAVTGSDELQPVEDEICGGGPKS